MTCLGRISLARVLYWVPGESGFSWMHVISCAELSGLHAMEHEFFDVLLIVDDAGCFGRTDEGVQNQSCNMKVHGVVALQGS